MATFTYNYRSAHYTYDNVNLLPSFGKDLFHMPFFFQLDLHHLAEVVGDRIVIVPSRALEFIVYALEPLKRSFLEGEKSSQEHDRAHYSLEVLARIF